MVRTLLLFVAVFGALQAHAAPQTPKQTIFAGVLELSLLTGDTVGPCKSPSSYAVCVRSSEMTPFEIGFDETRILEYLPYLEASGWHILSSGRTFRLMANGANGAATHCLLVSQALDIEVLSPRLMGHKVLRLELDPPGVVCGRPGDPPPPPPQTGALVEKRPLKPQLNKHPQPSPE